MYEYGCTVTRVVDGDTIDVVLDLGFSILHKCRVRLYGIDTPESRTKDLEEKFYGNISKAFLNDYCPKGSYITLRTHLDKKGKFGRILGEIIVNKVNLNEQMIEENLAVEYHGQSKTDIEKEHLRNRSILVRKGYTYS
jgi:micrococcal nuclease